MMNRKNSIHHSYFTLNGSANLPLHGTKLFVIIAIKRSLGESIILHPTIPAALHPKPIHMDSLR